METVLILLLVVVSGAFALRHMLRGLGVGTGSGRPDCGCGRCHEKRAGSR